MPASFDPHSRAHYSFVESFVDDKSGFRKSSSSLDDGLSTDFEVVMAFSYSRLDEELPDRSGRGAGPVQFAKALKLFALWHQFLL